MSTAKLASVETPEKAASRLAKKAGAVQRGFTKGKLHDYRDAAGNPLYWRIRLECAATGEKWIRPMRFDGHAYVLGEPPFPHGKPLYHLDQIAAKPEALVVITEGEKKADELAAVGLLVTTSGSADSATKADWKPLRGRRVVIWPDNDGPGQGYAEAVATILGGFGCDVSIIDGGALGLPPKGDASDWLAAHPGATADDVLALPCRPWPSTAAAVPGDAEPGVRLIDGSSVEFEPVSWVWPGYLPAGMLTILGGAPGCGKTTMAMSMAATITTAGTWPCGRRVQRPGRVLIWSGEDPLPVLAARLAAAGADMDMVSFVGDLVDGSAFDPGRDMDRLTQAADQLKDIRLLIIDPVVSAVAGDSHKNAEVRRSLQPVIRLAAKVGCSVLGITHFTKGSTGRDPVERITGSLAFAALARMVLVAAKARSDDGTDGGRVLLRAKSNVGPDDGGWVYRLDRREVASGVDGQWVIWGEPIEGTAREILAEAEPATGDDDPQGAVDAFLRGLLADGPLPAKTVRSDADGAGYAWRTVQRAAQRLGVERQKVGMRGGWMWGLTTANHHTKGAEDAEGAIDLGSACSAPSGGRNCEDAKDAKPDTLAPSAPSADRVAPSADDDVEVL